MTSAPFRVPGRLRPRRLRVVPRAALDCGAAQPSETVLFPPRWTVLSPSHLAAAQTCENTAPFADSAFLRFTVSIGAQQKGKQPVLGTGVAISPSTPVRCKPVRNRGTPH